MTEHLNVPVEVRAAADGPMLHGVILAEGRAAVGGRAEVFAPGAVTWPESGIAIRTEHHGAEATRGTVTREGTEIRVTAPATPAVVEAVRTKPYMSVEFYPLRETRTAGGVREIQRALVDAAALTDDPEYGQTRAEVRSRRRRVWL